MHDKFQSQQAKRIGSAVALATLAHEGQTRKYGGMNYITHPLRVCIQTQIWLPSNSEAAAAAVLHDVLEDTTTPASQIEMVCGKETLALVVELTNPSNKFPQISRAERKQMDREHIHSCSYEAQVIKALDRIDNLNEISAAPKDFRELYCQESMLLCKALTPALSQFGETELIKLFHFTLKEVGGVAP